MKRQKKSFLMLITMITLLFVSQGCGRYLNIEIKEYPDYGNNPPQKAFRLYPSSDGRTKLHLLSAYPIRDKFWALSLVYEAPNNWELSKAEYSVGGGWYDLPYGLYKFGAQWKYHYAKIYNQRDGRERFVTVRAWFRKTNQRVDLNTGRPYNRLDDLIGPIYINIPTYHSTR